MNTRDEWKHDILAYIEDNAMRYKDAGAMLAGIERDFGPCVPAMIEQLGRAGLAKFVRDAMRDIR